MRSLPDLYEYGMLIVLVDGGAWRTRSGQSGGGFDYPDTVITDEPFSSILEKSKM